MKILGFFLVLAFSKLCYPANIPLVLMQGRDPVTGAKCDFKVVFIHGFVNRETHFMIEVEVRHPRVNLRKPEYSFFYVRKWSDSALVGVNPIGRLVLNFLATPYEFRFRDIHSYTFIISNRQRSQRYQCLGVRLI